MARPSVEPSVTKLFRREEIIGRGNFGVVYSATNLITGQKVAIKALDLDTEHDEVKDVQHEVALLAQLTEGESTNITKYYGSYLVGSKLWIIMALCSGGSIRTLLKAGPLEERYISLIVRETAQALVQIHKHGIIHRDIKAANLLITDEGKLSLCDFGVAVDASFTQNKRSTIVGTPYWMAPEVIIEGKSYTSKADIWSLGITLYEMATGNPPYSEYEAMRALMMISKGRPPRLEGVPYSAALKSIVACCLDELPDERLSAEDLLKHKFVKQYQKVPTTTLRELLVKYKKWEEKEKGPRNSPLMFNAEQFEKIDGEDEVQRAQPLDDDSIWSFSEDEPDYGSTDATALTQSTLSSGNSLEMTQELADAPPSIRELFLDPTVSLNSSLGTRPSLPHMSTAPADVFGNMSLSSNPIATKMPSLPENIETTSDLRPTFGMPFGPNGGNSMFSLNAAFTPAKESPNGSGAPPVLPPIDAGRSISPFHSCPQNASSTTNTAFEFQSPSRNSGEGSLDDHTVSSHSRNPSVVSTNPPERLRSDSIGPELLHNNRPTAAAPPATSNLNMGISTSGSTLPSRPYRSGSVGVMYPTPLRSSTMHHDENIVPSMDPAATPQTPGSPESKLCRAMSVSNVSGFGATTNRHQTANGQDHSPGFFSEVGVLAHLNEYTANETTDNSMASSRSRTEIPRFPHTQPLTPHGQAATARPVPSRRTPPPPMSLPSFGQDSPSSRRHLQASQTSKIATRLVMPPAPVFNNILNTGNTLSAPAMSPGPNSMSPPGRSSQFSTQMHTPSCNPPSGQMHPVGFPAPPHMNLDVFLDGTPVEEIESQMKELLVGLDQALGCLAGTLASLGAQ